MSQFAGDGEVGDSLRATTAFSRAKAGAAEQEAVSYAALVAGDLSAEQRTAFIATQTSQQEASADLLGVRRPGQQTAGRTAWSPATRSTWPTRSPRELGRGVARRTARRHPGLRRGRRPDALGRAAARERRLAPRPAATATRWSGRPRSRPALVLLVLIVAIALAVVLARSLNLSLRRLREGALAVANRDLPDAVARLRDARNLGDGGAEDIVRQVRDPIRLHQPRRDRPGGAGVQRRAPGGGPDRGRAGRAAHQRLGDVPQPGPAQSVAGRPDDRRARLDRAHRGGPEAAGPALPARPPGHPDAPQRRKPAGARRRRLQRRRAARTRCWSTRCGPHSPRWSCTTGSSSARSTRTSRSPRSPSTTWCGCSPSCSTTPPGSPRPTRSWSPRPGASATTW